MSALSVRVPDELLIQVDDLARELHMARAEYVRQALEAKNKVVMAQKRRERLMMLSQRVQKESMVVNAEFAAIEEAPHV